MKQWHVTLVQQRRSPQVKGRVRTMKPFTGEHGDLFGVCSTLSGGHGLNKCPTIARITLSSWHHVPFFFYFYE